jgi:hypothetical protein
MDTQSRKRADEILGRYFGRCQFCTDRPRFVAANRDEDYTLTYKKGGKTVTCFWSKLCDGCESEVSDLIVESDDQDELLNVVKIRLSWRAAALALFE